MRAHPTVVKVLGVARRTASRGDNDKAIMRTLLTAVKLLGVMKISVVIRMWCQAHDRPRRQRDVDHADTFDRSEHLGHGKDLSRHSTVVKLSDVATSKAGYSDDDMTGMRKRWRSEDDNSGNERMTTRRMTQGRGRRQEGGGKGE